MIGFVGTRESDADADGRAESSGGPNVRAQLRSWDSAWHWPVACAGTSGSRAQGELLREELYGSKKGPPARGKLKRPCCGAHASACHEWRKHRWRQTS